MSIAQFKILLFLWQIGVLDSLTVLQICGNLASQYGVIVMTSVEGNWSSISPSILLEPLNGLILSKDYILAASTRAEQLRRLATITSLLGTSATSAIQLNPNVNGAVGATISAKIGYIKSILNRGGAASPSCFSTLNIPTNVNYFFMPSTYCLVEKKTVSRFFYTLNQQRINQEIVQQMFEQHKYHRFVQRVVYQPSPSLTNLGIPVIGCSKLNIRIIIGMTCTLTITGFVIGVSLFLFQRSKKRRFLKNKNIKKIFTTKN